MNDRHLRAMRGCGERPIMNHPDLPEEDLERWVPEEFEKAMDELEMFNNDMRDRQASIEYMYANIGNVRQMTGSYWDMCPAWWARFYDGPERSVADIAIEQSGWIERGAPDMVYADVVKTPRHVNLIALALNMRNHLSNVAQQRAYDEAKQKASR